MTIPRKWKEREREILEEKELNKESERKKERRKKMNLIVVIVEKS